LQSITNNTDNIGIGLDNKVYDNSLKNQQNAYMQTAFAYGNISTITYAIGNGTDVVSWDNGIVGNYWSDYNGEGNYIIDAKNVDHHPLSQQVNISTSAPTTSNNTLTIAIIAPIVILAIIVFSMLVYRRYRKTASKPKE